jgi:DNA-binding transcriptional ArsR family regulator
VLERAGLIEKSKRGREQFIRVKPEVAKEAEDWITHYSRYWRAQFDAVEDYLNLKNKKGEEE